MSLSFKTLFNDGLIFEFISSGKPFVTGRSAINFASKFFINFLRDYLRHLINSVHYVYSISDNTVVDRSARYK